MSMTKSTTSTLKTTRVTLSSSLNPKKNSSTITIRYNFSWIMEINYNRNSMITSENTTNKKLKRKTKKEEETLTTNLRSVVFLWRKPLLSLRDCTLSVLPSLSQPSFSSHIKLFSKMKKLLSKKLRELETKRRELNLNKRIFGVYPFINIRFSLNHISIMHA